jgi:hypothetical protein
VEGTARILESVDEREAAEAALDRHYGRKRRIYERVMTSQRDMVYLEVTVALEAS